MHPFTPTAATPLSALTLDERTELRLGRAHWTVADYLAEGRREFDENHERLHGARPANPVDREHYARCYVQMFCPAGKRIAKLGEIA